jgi:hypothetical protein
MLGPADRTAESIRGEGLPLLSCPLGSPLSMDDAAGTRGRV